MLIQVITTILNMIQIQNMKTRSILVVLLFLSLNSDSFSQSKERIDSLEQVVASNVADSAKLKALRYLCYELSTKDPDIAMKYGIQGLELAKELNIRSAIAKSLHVLGALDRKLGDYKGAINYFLNEQKILLALDDKKRLAKCMLSIGMVHGRQSSYDKELQHYLKALTIYEEVNEPKDIAYSMNTIGQFYRGQNNEVLALEYFKKSLTLFETLTNTEGIAHSLGNLANLETDRKNYKNAMKMYRRALNIYREHKKRGGESAMLYGIGRVYRKMGKLDSALAYSFKSLKIKEEIGNRRSVASGLRWIGFLYENMEDYPRAIEYFVNSMKVDSSLNDRQGMSLALYHIGRNFTMNENPEKALIYLTRGLSIAQELNLKKEKKWICNEIVIAYVQQKNYKKAFEYHELYVEIKDSLFNEDMSKELGRLEANFEYDKKVISQQVEHEKEKVLAAEKLRRQKLIGYSLLGGFGFMLILAFMAYRSYREKKRANILLENKNAIIEEIHKDITDSINYAQNIQSAILPKESEIGQIFEKHFIYFQPRDVVSGDFYWFTHKNDMTYLAVCDCTGHGVPGAFVSMIGNDLLNHIIMEKGFESPGEILTQLNNGVKSVFTREGSEQEAQDGMDMVLCTFDKDLKSLEFAGAKNPLFIIRNNVLTKTRGDSNPIGGDTPVDTVFTNHQIELQKGDTLYLITDGYQDQFGGEKGKKFMIKRFKELLISIQDKDMKEQREIIHKNITEWKGDTPQVDDICVIGIRV